MSIPNLREIFSVENLYTGRFATEFDLSRLIPLFLEASIDHCADTISEIPLAATYKLELEGYPYQIKILKSIRIVDIAALQTDEKIKQEVDQLYEEYVQTEKSNFHSDKSRPDPARILPRIHKINDEYLLFPFGYIRDRIAHDPKKVGYRLEFFTKELGGGSGGYAYELITVGSTKSAERCVKDTIIDRDLENPLIEAQVLEKLAYSDYKFKGGILYYKNNQARMLLPQKKQPGLTLDNYLKLNKLTGIEALETCLTFCKDILKFHDKDIIHRDVSPFNVIAKNKTTLKTIDFGFSLFRTTASQYRLGHECYRAPEAWKGEYSFSTDFWAALIMMREFFNSNSAAAATHPVFSADHPLMREVFFANLKSRLHDLPEKTVELVITLFENGLCEDKAKRWLPQKITESFEEAIVMYHRELSFRP